ncbi:MAG: ferredoxin family protein [Candidatus Njordarchaeales archaeon]
MSSSIDERKLSIDERLSLDNFEIDKESHIIVDTNICKRCVSKVCVYACPAHLYRLENGEIIFNHEGCLECGTCRIVCPLGAIKWNNPRGGFGIHYRYG